MVAAPKLPLGSSSACIACRCLQTPYLGRRSIDAKGQAGPYVWQSYADVEALLSGIGSGMQHLGIQPGSAVGLYSGTVLLAKYTSLHCWQLCRIYHKAGHGVSWTSWQWCCIQYICTMHRQTVAVPNAAGKLLS